MKQTNIEKKRFFEFREDVLKCSAITIDDLWMYIRRHTQGNMGRRFFNSELKARYYKFWIKMMEGEGKLLRKGHSVFKIIK